MNDNFELSQESDFIDMFPMAKLFDGFYDLVSRESFLKKGYQDTTNEGPFDKSPSARVACLNAYSLEHWEEMVQGPSYSSLIGQPSSLIGFSFIRSIRLDSLGYSPGYLVHRLNPHPLSAPRETLDFEQRVQIDSQTLVEGGTRYAVRAYTETTRSIRQNQQLFSSEAAQGHEINLDLPGMISFLIPYWAVTLMTAEFEPVFYNSLLTGLSIGGSGTRAYGRLNVGCGATPDQLRTRYFVLDINDMAILSRQEDADNLPARIGRPCVERKSTVVNTSTLTADVVDVPDPEDADSDFIYQIRADKNHSSGIGHKSDLVYRVL